MFIYRLNRPQPRPWLVQLDDLLLRNAGHFKGISAVLHCRTETSKKTAQIGVFIKYYLHFCAQL